MFFGIYLGLSFLLPRGIHLFPITSSPSPACVPLCHFALTPPASFFSLCILSLGAEWSCFSAGVQGVRPRRVLVSQVFIKLSAMSTRTNCSSLLLNRSQILTSMLTFLLGGQSPSPRSLSSSASSVCTGLCEREKAYVQVCWSGRPSQKPCFLPGIIDLTNCQPCFILKK